jgi:hypothetical protein
MDNLTGVINSAIVKYLRKMGIQTSSASVALGLRKAYDSFSREVLCNTLTVLEFVIHLKI